MSHPPGCWWTSGNNFLHIILVSQIQTFSLTPSSQFYVSRASEAFISPASNVTTGSGPDKSWFDDTFDRFKLREEPPGDEEETMNSVGIPIEGGPGLSITTCAASTICLEALQSVFSEDASRLDTVQASGCTEPTPLTDAI